MFHRKAEDAHTTSLLGEQRLSCDFMSKGSITKEAIAVSYFCLDNTRRRLHFHPLWLLAGCLFLLFLVCTWWYLYWQGRGKDEKEETGCWGLEGIFRREAHPWNWDINSIGFHLLKNIVVCFTTFMKAIKRCFFFCGIISCIFLAIYERSWLWASHTADNCRIKSWTPNITTCFQHSRVEVEV